MLTEPLDLRRCPYRAGDAEPFLTADCPGNAPAQERIGRHALVPLIDLQPAEPLPVDALLEYDLRVQMTGDQIYCDDVAGPILASLRRVIEPARSA